MVGPLKGAREEGQQVDRLRRRQVEASQSRDIDGVTPDTHG